MWRAASAETREIHVTDADPKRDDRGRRWRAQGAVYDRAIRARGHDPRTLLNAPGIDAPIGGAAIVAIVVSAVGYLVFIALTWGALPGAAYWLLFLPFSILAIVVERIMKRIAATPTRRQGSLALGLCPGCGYSIVELEAEPDGCRVCPECGAAWHLEPHASERGDVIRPTPTQAGQADCDTRDACP